MTRGPGQHIKTLRETYQVSRETLAERSGLDIAQISRIEDEGLIPDLAPLVRIARALGVRLGTILDENEECGPLITRSGEAESAARFLTGAVDGTASTPKAALRFHALAAGKSSRHMEPFIVDVEPGAEQQKSAHEGEEFIHVLSGRMSLEYGKDTYILAPGDSVYYDSIVPHRVLSASEDQLRILAVIYTPV